MIRASQNFSLRVLQKRSSFVKISGVGILGVFLLLSGPVQAQMCSTGVVEAPVIQVMLKEKVFEVSSSFDVAQAAIGLAIDQAAGLMTTAMGKVAQAARQDMTQQIENSRFEKLAKGDAEAARRYEPSVAMCQFQTSLRQMTFRTGISNGVKKAFRARASKIGPLVTQAGEIPFRLAMTSNDILEWGNENELNALGVDVVPKGSVGPQNVDRDLRLPTELTINKATPDGVDADRAADAFERHAFLTVQACARGAEHQMPEGVLKDEECRKVRAKGSLAVRAYHEYRASRTLPQTTSAVAQKMQKDQKAVYEAQGLTPPTGLVSQAQFTHDIMATPSYEQFRSLAGEPQIGARQLVQEQMELALASWEYDREVDAALMAGARLATALQDRHDRREAAGLSAVSVPLGKGG